MKTFKISFNVFFIVAIFVMLSSCNDTVNSANGNKPLIPLKKGNTWFYKVTEYDTLNNQIKLSYTDTSFIKSDTSNIFYFNLIPGVNEDGGLIQDHDGIHYYYYIWYVDEIINELLFKYPVSEGESYISMETFKFTVKFGQTITVPAGSFNCIEYDRRILVSQDNTIAKYYLSPGIGLVKFETLIDNGLSNRKIETYELLNFEIQ